MKYYIRATNTRTKQTVIMHSPTFTSKTQAQEYAEQFCRLLANTSAEIVTKRGRVYEAC